ncbi:MAG: ATP--guanido phosphotransferase [Clostridia bacterium]|nr:ATP--guanido phosphotransferase [Clostridia bacterium]
MNERLFEQMQDSVVSTRIRLARNIHGLPFPQKMTGADATVALNSVYKALGGRYELITVNDTPQVVLGALVERHLISKELLSSPNGAVLLGNDDTVSVMLCEEDHIRLQVILPGFALENAYAVADGVDEIIGMKVKYAYSSALGHLTACPTNVGTGMRASVMLFLPALTLTKTLTRQVNSLVNYHITLRGVYGEGSDALGYFYQVSNAQTLGLSEEETVQNVKKATSILLYAEQNAREIMYEKNEIKIKDEVSRAYGILRSAYTLSADEYLQRSAFVKLGAYYGLLPVTDVPAIDEMITAMQHYNLISSADLPLETDIARDIYRAKQARKFFGDLTKL